MNYINRKRSMIKSNKIIAFIVALSCIIYLRPYFVWNTYRNGNLTFLRNVSIISTYVILFLYFFLEKKYEKIIKTKLHMAALFFCIYFLLLFCGDMRGFTAGNFLFLFFVTIFILCDDDFLRLVFDYFSLLFALTLIIPIITWILLIMGIELPHDTLTPWETIKMDTSWYDHYFLAVFRMEKYGRKLLYLNGIYDEQGVVGTFCALLLVADNMKIKNNWKNIVLLIGGILSLSVAFVVMIILYFIMTTRFSFRKKAIIVIGFFAILGLVISAFNQSLFVREFVSRFVNIDTFNNRYDDSFGYFYQNNMRFDRLTTWLGHGKDAFGMYNSSLGDNLMNASTYKILVYDYGYVGFGAILLLFTFGSVLYHKNFDGIVFSLIFLASIYQRPYVLTLSYIVLFISGNAMNKFLRGNETNGSNRNHYYL